MLAPHKAPRQLLLGHLLMCYLSLPADAFADAAEQEEDTSGVDYVHIRVQQRNGKKSLTTVQVSWPCCCRAVRAPLQAMQTDWLPRVLRPAGTQEVV